MLQEKAEILDGGAMNRAIMRIAYEILERNRGAENLCILGIQSRGVYLARRISRKIGEIEGSVVETGELDITPYRDDLKGKERPPEKSHIPFPVENRQVVLVDDVIFTGRTVRAAIDAVLRRGRPQNIQLAALIDRGHRELPIRPDFIGKNLPTSREEVVRVMVAELDGVDRVTICAEGL